MQHSVYEAINDKIITKDEGKKLLNESNKLYSIDKIRTESEYYINDAICDKDLMEIFNCITINTMKIENNNFTESELQTILRAIIIYDRKIAYGLRNKGFFIDGFTAKLDIKNIIEIKKKLKAD